MTTVNSESLLTRTIRPLLQPPADVVFGIGVATVSAAVILLTNAPFSAVFALPLLLFLPGYAAVSLLFPAQTASADGISVTVGSLTRSMRLDLGERAALSFGMSVAFLPVVGLALFVSGLHITQATVVGTLATGSTLGLLFASYRRWSLPETARFRVPFGEWRDAVADGLFGTSVVDGLLNIAVAVAIVVALSVLVYSLVLPPAASYTDFSVLTTSNSGELVAADYPAEMTQGVAEPVVLSVTNNEGTQMTYTVVVELQRVETASGAVVERSGMSRVSGTVAAGETWQPSVQLIPQLAGDDLRVAIYLYEGAPPDTPSAESASEFLFFWTDVTTG